MIVGAGPGGGGQVNVYQGTNSPTQQIVIPDTRFRGGVRVATADFTGDGIRDYVFASGPGAPSFVEVVDGVTGKTIFSIQPFEAAFDGGVNVSVGDITGDGVPELIISPDQGGGPRVMVFSGANFVKIADFFGIDDPDFRGGARTAVGDINGDGFGDLVVAAGFGGGPRVAIYNGLSVIGGSPVRLTADFFAFEPQLRNGAYVAVLDINGDGFGEVVAGAGPGGGPRVTAFSGKALLAGQVITAANFFAGNQDARGGVRVSSVDFDGNLELELAAGAGEGDGSTVRVYSAPSLLQAAPTPLAEFEAFPGFSGGVYVG